MLLIAIANALRPRPHVTSLTLTVKRPYTATDVTAVYRGDEEVRLPTLGPGQSHTFPRRTRQTDSATYERPIDLVTWAVDGVKFRMNVPDQILVKVDNIHFFLDPNLEEGFELYYGQDFEIAVTELRAPEIEMKLPVAVPVPGSETGRRVGNGEDANEA